MSEADKEEIEKAKNRFHEIIEDSKDWTFDHPITTLEVHYLEILLNYIQQLEQNSIPKSKVEEKINQLKEKNRGPIAVYEFRENGIIIIALEELLKGE